MANLIELESLSIGYDRKLLTEPINLEIGRGEFWGIIGPNGGGKSTLLRTVTGLLPPLGGCIRLDNNTVFGYLPQHEKLDSFFPVSVREIASMGAYSKIGPGKKLTPADTKRVNQVLGLVGVSDLGSRPFRSLSGGEKQRTLLARALCGEPDVLVLDEPTASVDLKGEQEIMDLIKTLNSEKKIAILMVSHFVNTIREYTDKTIFINIHNDKFISGNTVEVLNNQSIKGDFGIDQDKPISN